MFAADDHAVHSPRALCPLWSTYTTQTNGSVTDTLPPYCCWSLWWISADGTFSPKRNLITMRCSTLRGTFCSLITLATPRQDWTSSNPSRREGGGCGFTLSRSHSCCAVRLVYTQISPGHIWTTLYLKILLNSGILNYCHCIWKVIANCFKKARITAIDRHMSHIWKMVMTCPWNWNLTPTMQSNVDMV